VDELDVRQKNNTQMKLNLNVLLSCGTFLLWLGVALGVTGVVLFVASGGYVGISTTSTSRITNPSGSVQVSTSIACGVRSIGALQRLPFLLPMIAGSLLVFSGYSIRNTIQNLKAEQAVDGNPH
jgi:hypothetical protein